MIKIINRIVIIAACIVIFPLIFFFVNSGWYAEPIEKTKLTTSQVAEICENLKFDLTPEETMVTRYWPGFLQDTISLTVIVNHIKSEEDFLTHFHGTVKGKVKDTTDSSSVYTIELFDLDRIPKDYTCQLSFANNGDNLFCKFFISGYISELDNIYQFLDNPFQPYLKNGYFMKCVYMESVLIMFLIVQKIVGFIKKRDATV